MATPLGRPISFLPGDIAALIHDEVVAQHVEEAAFLWTLRHRAADDAHYRLDDLAALDRRVEAHLSGLRAAGDVGWNMCRTALEDAGPGQVFAMGVLAFDAGDRRRMHDALLAACASPGLRCGLVAALGWLPYARIAPWLQLLLASKASEHRWIGISAAAAHRHDPGRVLPDALEADDAFVRARALRAAGELKRVDLAAQIHAHLRDEDPAARFWAAWSAVLLLRDRAAVEALKQATEAADAFSIPALQLVLRVMPAADAKAWIRTLTTRSEQPRLTISATGTFGDPAAVPWLIEQMKRPELARLAGEAFSQITGADLAYLDLDQDPPAPLAQAVPGDDGLVPLDNDTNLPWPDPFKVVRWWKRNRAGFSAGSRYLCGQAVHPSTLATVLLKGRQRQRAAAALEWACTGPAQAFVEIRERGDRQKQRLSQWIS